MAADEGPPAGRASSWEPFLAGKTTVQRLVLALGALAGALLAVVAVVTGAIKAFDHPTGFREAGAGVQQVQNQTESADEFVRFLLKASAAGSPVQLDHQLVAPRGQGGEFRLEYACEASGCRFVRLETPGDIPAVLADGVWYQGCWSVATDGAGYGAEHLDLELRRRGDTCP